jgi:hypothetical protein
MSQNFGAKVRTTVVVGLESLSDKCRVTRQNAKNRGIVAAKIVRIAAFVAEKVWLCCGKIVD